MEVKVYATLRLKIGRPTIDVDAKAGETVRAAVRQVIAQYPVLAPDILAEDNELVKHVHVFLSGRNVRLLEGLDTIIQEGQRLDIFPPVGGGSRPPVGGGSRPSAGVCEPLPSVHVTRSQMFR
jgi:molybdopterin synthase sulfur carrier subunit